MEEQNGLSGLPANWTWRTLSDLCIKIQDGTHFSPKDQFASGQYKYITAKNIRPSGLDLSDVTYLSESDHRAIYDRCDPKRDDVLLVKDGVNTGDAALNTLDEEFSLLSSVCLLRPEQSLLSSPFLRYYLLSPIGYRLLTGQMTGTAIKRIILRRIKELPSPVAPLSQQHRIVAKIEELFTKLDAGVESLNAAKKQLKRYRKSVLKAAVEGELTREWREQHKYELEPTSVLLERILRERRAKWEADQLAKMQAQAKTPKDDEWKARYQEPTAPDISNLSELPKEWKWTLTQQLGEVQLGRQRSPRNRSKDYPTKYIRAANITERGLDLSHVLDMEFEPHEIERYLLDNGDIVLSEASGSPTQVGKPAIWRNQFSICCFQNTVIRLRPNGIPSEYLLVVFKGYYVNGLFSKIAAGVGINHLSADKFSTIPIPLPPLAEQAQIVAEVERRLSVADEIEATLDAELKRAERLRQSILKRAFEGKLVPQDPNDEPAPILLERIKAQKARLEAEVKSKKSRRGKESGNGSLFS
ncbi:MAG: restriction endonuclease subunit S [Acidobacteria bacterium]|nr:restriction endonuclease subunit S [Acidobacteriota bacterium]